MQNSQTFSGDLYGDGIRWMVLCASVAVAIFVGWMTDTLEVICIVAICIFVTAQGLVPFGRFALRLGADREKCQREKSTLQRIPVENASKLKDIDASDAGSVFKLALAVTSNKDRLAETGGGQQFLDVARQEWEAEIKPIENSAEQAPILGLGGSLIGMLGALQNLAGVIGDEGGINGFSDLFAAMSTMMTTTLTGVAGAFMLIGLNSRAKNSMEKHLAELKVIASLVSGERDPEDDDDDGYLLTRRGAA